jgi:hypothetical protein
VHALPGHDDRPGDRTGRYRAAAPRSANSGWDARLDGVTFGMNAIVVEGEGRYLAAGTPAAFGYRF